MTFLLQNEVVNTSVSVPTRLFADWAPDPSRPVHSSSQPAGASNHWSSLRQVSDTQALADKARSYILSMLHQETGPRPPSK